MCSKSFDHVTLQQEVISHYHGREQTDHPDTDQLSARLPPNMWSSGPTDVGFCQSAQPVVLSFLKEQILCTDVLFQKKKRGGNRVVLIYASLISELSEARQPACTKYAAGLAEILHKVAPDSTNVPWHHGIHDLFSIHILTRTKVKNR